MSDEIIENKEVQPVEPITQDELFEHYRILVDPKQKPTRIDKFLLDRIEKVSRTKIQNACKAGSVLVDEKPVKSNFKIKPHQVIKILLSKPPRENQPVLPEDIPLDIRYEDDDVMVIYKPSGMVVHPGTGVSSGTLVNALVFHHQKNKKDDLPVMEGNQIDRPGLVHRIDKDTSGLMVVAKNEMAISHLAKQFFDHSIERKYQALIWGEFDEDEGTINAKVGRHPKNRIKMFVFDEEDDQGKVAITHYKVLKRMYYVSLIECQLETGRTHQIRVHMKHMGHPLFNDEKYDGHKIVKGTVFTKYKQFVKNCFDLMPRQALHAKSLGFVHPRTNEKMFFESDLPEEFEAVVEKWNSYVAGRKKLM